MSSSYTECPTCGDMTLAHDDGKKLCLKSDKSDSGFVPEEECYLHHPRGRPHMTYAIPLILATCFLLSNTGSNSVLCGRIS